MSHSHQGMEEYHSWAGEAHYLAHTLAHVGLVAMYWALTAGAFSLAELTMLQAAVDIFQQLAATIAQSAVTLFISAIYGYHCRNGLFLSLYP